MGQNTYPAHGAQSLVTPPSADAKKKMQPNLGHMSSQMPETERNPEAPPPTSTQPHRKTLASEELWFAMVVRVSLAMP